MRGGVGQMGEAFNGQLAALRALKKIGSLRPLKVQDVLD